MALHQTQPGDSHEHSSPHKPGVNLSTRLYKWLKVRKPDILHMREKKDQLGLRFMRINHCSENNHLAINDTCTDSRPVQREAGVTQLLQWVVGGGRFQRYHSSGAGT